MEGSLEHFNHPMNDLRKEVLGWMRYYGQLNNLFRALEEDPDGLFPTGEARLLRLLEQRTGRLREEAQLLREYCLQVGSCSRRKLTSGKPDHEDPSPLHHPFFCRCPWWPVGTE